ncbi:hypothetical protein KY337_03960 [Candidatus Woesearchaeota archaeon]|nr:hypothetical protein [Candidatus Woesearchaeota archaeon]
MKRGQAALEFLMTYGWVILIVIIVIGALAAFGVFDVTRLVPDRCVLPSSLSCRDFGATYGTPTILQIEVLNSQGRSIDVTSLIIDDRDSAIQCVSAAGVPNIANGATGVLNANCVAAPGGANIALTPGQKYRMDVRVNYQFTGGTISKDALGELTITGPYAP